MNLGKLYLANAITFVIMDILALLLPLGAVFNLRMPMRKKWELAGLFGLGLFVCVASFVRITTLFGFNVEPDPTWVTVNSHIWSMIEVNVGIITVCIPTIKPFFVIILRPLIFGPDATTSNSKYGTGNSVGRAGAVNSDKHHPASAKKGSIVQLKSSGATGKGDITLSTQQFIEHEMNGFHQMGGGESEEELDKHNRVAAGRGRRPSTATSERELR